MKYETRIQLYKVCSDIGCEEVQTDTVGPKFIIRVNNANQYDSLLVLKLQVEAKWS